MRRLVAIVAVLFGVAACTVPAAMAGTVSLSLSSTSTNTTFDISGIYAPGTPSVTDFSAAGQAYALSFTVLTNASTNAGFIPDGFDGIFFVNADMTLSFEGSTFDLGTLQIEFDNVLNGNFGGLLFCVDTPGMCTTGTTWTIAGQQLFAGSVTSPTFGIPGLTPGTTLDAQVDENPILTGYNIGNVGPFPFGPTPEPTPIFLLGTGLLAVGYFTRKLRSN